LDRSWLEGFFERLLAEPKEGPDNTNTAQNPADPAITAALSVALTNSKAADVKPNDDATKLALYLDGAFDPREAEDFAARIANQPAELYELQAANSFLDAVAVQKKAAPQDLVAAALAAATRDMPRIAKSGRRVWNLGNWGRHWAWAGGAFATAVLAVVIVTGEMGQRAAVPFVLSAPVPSASPSPADSGLTTTTEPNAAPAFAPPPSVTPPALAPTFSPPSAVAPAAGSGPATGGGAANTLSDVGSYKALDVPDVGAAFGSSSAGVAGEDLCAVDNRRLLERGEPSSQTSAADRSTQKPPQAGCPTVAGKPPFEPSTGNADAASSLPESEIAPRK
jgi:hypothetical protein